jgi:hypothetical protein
VGRAQFHLQIPQGFLKFMKNEAGFLISLFVMVLFFPFAAGSEEAYKGLTPGLSTKAQVDATLGVPAAAISETLFEYGARQKAQKIYVQYRKNNMVADRIEVFLTQPESRAALLVELGLPSQSEKTRTNTRGKLEELFGSPKNIILTYSSGDSESGVTRIGYYSGALYGIAVKESAEPPKAQATPPNTSSIGSSVPPATPSRPPTPPAGSQTTPSYEDLNNQAWNAMLARDFATALNLLQDATKKDPEQSNAYTFLGVAYLYGYNDLMSAERVMRQAIEKGGKALFRVHHDHDGFFKTFCYGWLYIGKSEIVFKSDDGQMFEINDSMITEAAVNKLIGANYFAFHIKTASKNLNFAPGSVRLPETNLILNLMNGY